MSVKLTIDKKTGDIKIEGVDIIGAGCITELDKIANAINAITVDRKKKQEFYATYKKVKIRG